MKAAKKPRWLRKEEDEWKWAYGYMERNADDGIAIRINYVQKDRLPSHETCLHVISYLGETEDGRGFVGRLRESLRQYRKRRSTTDKKVCTFTLPTKTKKRLSRIAEDLKISESCVVATALEQVENLAEEYRKRESKIENARAIERKEAKQHIDLLRAKHHEAMRQIQKLATRLSIWELALDTEHPGIVIDEARLDSARKEKIKAISKAIKQAISQSALLLPRS